MNPLQHYWRLEIEICRTAAELGMRKAEMLSRPLDLPWDIRESVEAMLWEQAHWLERRGKMAQYGFLVQELEAELTTAHHVYRAVRAAWRLSQESELKLTPAQHDLVLRLTRSLEAFCDKGTDSSVDTLPLIQARRFVSELRGLVAASKDSSGARRIGSCT